MTTPTSGSLQPTYTGHVATTSDALLLFEACLSGRLHHVPRRPHDRERSSLVRSGCVFIYEENASGIKRWTDGVPWSPSRILGNFLVYRELLKPFPPGEKKRATKRNKRPTKPGEPYPRADSANNGSNAYSPTSPPTPSFKQEGSFDKETERSLIGSLVDSYGFKDGGLVKKTMSVNVQGVHHHLVSYYKVDEVMNGTLEQPTQSPRLQDVKPRNELTLRQNFRAPLDDPDDSLDAQFDGQRAVYGYSDRMGLERGPLLTPSYHHPQQQLPAHNGYYNGVGPPQYSAPAHHQTPVSTAYSMSGSTATPPQGSYYGHNTGAPHLLPKVEDFTSYHSVSPYGPRFDPLNVSVGPGSIPNDRGPAQPHANQFPHPLRSRSDDNEPPQMIDAKNARGGYDRNYYPGTSRTDNGPYQAADPRWAASPAVARQGNSMPYQSEKQQYWPENATSSHGHYTNTSPMQHWSQNTV
ncbi:MAG: hypothetical protein M1827_005711 [Pycnora praestabilis]|nr:MAG: hypothetical protein M1827_005711 [Pycnora praestabilis]